LFSFYLPAEASARREKKKSRAKIKNVNKTFLWGGERQRAAAGWSVSLAQMNFTRNDYIKT